MRSGNLPVLRYLRAEGFAVASQQVSELAAEAGRVEVLAELRLLVYLLTLAATQVWPQVVEVVDHVLLRIMDLELEAREETDR